MNQATVKGLQSQHNRLVKPMYKVEDPKWFEHYLRCCGNYDSTLVDGVNYVEIPSNETISGNPAVLNWD